MTECTGRDISIFAIAFDGMFTPFGKIVDELHQKLYNWQPEMFLRQKGFGCLHPLFRDANSNFKMKGEFAAWNYSLKNDWLCRFKQLH